MPRAWQQRQHSSIAFAAALLLQWDPRAWFAQLSPGCHLTAYSVCLHIAKLCFSPCSKAYRNCRNYPGMCFPAGSGLPWSIELVCFLHVGAGKACPHAAAPAHFRVLKDMVCLSSTASVFVGQTEVPVGQLYIFSCKCRSAGCRAEYSLSLKHRSSHTVSQSIAFAGL